MKIEKIPEGYLLARKGGNGCELWRKFNGAESMACDAIDELIAERDALRAKIEAMNEAMESLLIRCDDSDSAMYGTLSTSFVRDTVRIARGALEESK